MSDLNPTQANAYKGAQFLLEASKILVECEPTISETCLFFANNIVNKLQQAETQCSCEEQKQSTNENIVKFVKDVKSEEEAAKEIDDIVDKIKANMSNDECK
jgi:hypothetical protein